MEEPAKIAYQSEIETYLESNGVYDFFEQLMTEIIYEKPIDVVEFLIQRIEHGPRHRYFLVGPTGFDKNKIAPAVAKRLGLEVISTEDIIKEEIQRESTLGKYFQEYINKSTFIRDDAICKAVLDKLQAIEKTRKGYILVGFPRTRLQALALHKRNIVPTKVLVQSPYDKEKFLESAKKQIVEGKEGIKESTGKYKPKDERQDLIEAGENRCTEYELNIREVVSIYKEKVYNLQTESGLPTQISDCLKLISLPNKSNAPRTPPRVAIIGPIGSGRSTQAQSISASVGLVYISIPALVLDAGNRASDFAATIRSAQASGAEVPLSIITALLADRLSQQDCQVGGWVIDGFPKTVEEAKGLEDAGYGFSKAIFLDESDGVATERNETRQYDPETGEYYHIGKEPTDEDIRGRLVAAPVEHFEAALQAYRDQQPVLLSYFGNRATEIPQGHSISQVTDIIENSLSLPITP